MNTVVINEDMPVLVEFAPAPGTRGVSITPENFEQKSAEASK